MAEGKIDRGKLRRMLSEGKKLKECAEHFDVSIPAISKAKKQLGLIIAKDVQLESAHRFVNEHLDTVGQLRKINDNAHDLLDLCMRWINGDPEAIQVLESQVRKVRVGDSEETVAEYKFKDPREIALKAMAEIRGQLRLQNETLAMLAEMSAVHEFQQELVNLLKEIDPKLRDEFCARIDQRQALRRAVRVIE
jgi:hypothetical protein